MPAQRFRGAKWHWQAKTHTCAVFSRCQVALAGENARLRGVFEAPRGTGKRKHTPAQRFRGARWHWQAKMHACAVFEVPASENARLRSVFEAPSGTGRQKRMPAQCFRGAKWHRLAKTHARAPFSRRHAALAGENARLRSVSCAVFSNWRAPKSENLRRLLRFM